MNSESRFLRFILIIMLFFELQTIQLYERCLIACALYPEYWVRYVQRMDEEGKTELALDALHRATVTFVKVCFSFMKVYSLLVLCSCLMNSEIEVYEGQNHSRRTNKSDEFKYLVVSMMLNFFAI